MRKFGTWMMIAAVFGIVFSAQPRPVEAQKAYFDAFVAKYENVAEEAKAKKCAVCHGKQKKMRSDYAKALEEALGEKKVKDKDKINAALDEVAEMENGDGDKYGDLLADGKLPAPYSE